MSLARINYLVLDGLVVDVRNGYGYSKKWASGLEKDLVELLAE